MTKKERQDWLKSIRKLISHLSFSIFNQKLFITVFEDKKWGKRLYLQIFYNAPCTKTGKIEEWKGRKWYLSPHMTESEVIFTAYSACEAAVKHEIMEGFKFDNQIVINPHVDFRKLLEVSPNEVQRIHIDNFDV